MEYITVQEIAEKWDVSVRQVQRLLAADRIPGAKKYGRAWMIPVEAVKPEDFRKEKRMAEKDDSSRNAEIVKASIPMPLMNSPFEPGQCKAWIESFEDEDVKEIARAEYYYFRGRPERVVKLVEPYLTSKDLSQQLSAFLLFSYANLSLGHTHQAHYGLEQLAKIIQESVKKNPVPQIQAFSVFFATTARVLLHLPLDGLPSLMEYLRYLPSGLQLYACYVMAHHAYIEGDYSKSLGIAETGFAMQEKICPISAIYLHIMMAISLMGMKRTEEAKKQFMIAWEMAQPDDLIEGFGEHHGLLHGLIETCIKPKYPKDYERIIAITYSFSAGWRKIHNPATSGNVADNLTTTEFTIAMLANRRWTNAEIASYMHLSEHTIKRYISDIYQKLGITSRRELHQFMLR